MSLEMSRGAATNVGSLAGVLSSDDSPAKHLRPGSDPPRLGCYWTSRFQFISSVILIGSIYVRSFVFS